jgi:hypothetical protein
LSGAKRQLTVITLCQLEEKRRNKMKTYRFSETLVFEHPKVRTVDLNRCGSALLEPLARHLDELQPRQRVLVGDWDFTAHGYVPTETGKYGFALIDDGFQLHLVWSRTTDDTGEFALPETYLRPRLTVVETPEKSEPTPTEASFLTAAELRHRYFPGASVEKVWAMVVAAGAPWTTRDGTPVVDAKLVEEYVERVFDSLRFVKTSKEWYLFESPYLASHFGVCKPLTKSPRVYNTWSRFVVAPETFAGFFEKNFEFDREGFLTKAQMRDVLSAAGLDQKSQSAFHSYLAAHRGIPQSFAYQLGDGFKYIRLKNRVNEQTAS